MEHKYSRKLHSVVQRADIDMHERMRLHILDTRRPHGRALTLVLASLCVPRRQRENAVHHTGRMERRITHIPPNHGQIAPDGFHIWEIAGAFLFACK